MEATVTISLKEYNSLLEIKKHNIESLDSIITSDGWGIQTFYLNKRDDVIKGLLEKLESIRLENSKIRQQNIKIIEENTKNKYQIKKKWYNFV